MSQSQTVLVGNITNDPELKFTEKGQAKITFGLAVNYYWTDQDGEKKERTSYFNVVAWRQNAEDIARVAEKGVGVIVSGRLEQRSWEKDDGTKGNIVELIADNLGLLARSVESFERRRRNSSDDSSAARKTTERTRPAARPQLAEEEEPF